MYPIKTFIGNDTVVKVCTEDVSKVRKNVLNVLERTCENIVEKFDRWYSDSKEGFYLDSKGKATCDGNDEFDLETGEEIAFRKVKLVATIKKYKMLEQTIRQFEKAIDELEEIQSRYAIYIHNDVKALRKFNPEYNPNI